MDMLRHESRVREGPAVLRLRVSLRQTWRDIQTARMPRATPSGPPGPKRAGDPPHKPRAVPRPQAMPALRGACDRLMGDGEAYTRGLSHRGRRRRRHLNSVRPSSGARSVLEVRGLSLLVLLAWGEGMS